MKAVRVHSFGTPDVLVVEEVAVPEPGPGQVLVRVESAAVNFADIVRRRNGVYPFPTVLPFTPGSEVAGMVSALGAGVVGPAVGTPVFALVGRDGSTGYAQYALADVGQVVPIPAGLSSDEAAGMVVAGSTAVLTLTHVADLQPNETVLVQGAGGGVGGFAVQIAKLMGATVVGAASTPARREAALAWGADHVVDYTRAGWADDVREVTAGRGVDVVVEVAGGDTFSTAVSVLAPFGRIVVVGQAGGVSLELRESQIRSLFYDPALNQSLHAFNLGLFFGLRPQVAIQALQTLLGYVGSGQVKVPLGPILPMSEVGRAHRLIEDRQTTGKVILKPWS